MASSSNRITGLATGMDIDSIVEATMQAYKTKVDKKKQEKNIVEIKQQLYRDLIKEGQDFYNKYFDITKSDSLLSSKNYKSVAFKSSNDLVATANATSSAIKDNYTVNVEQLASSARMEIKVSDIDKYNHIEVEINGDKILINSDELKDEVKDKDGNVIGKEFKSAKEQAKVINNKLSEYGLKASVSDFSSGNIIIETTKKGSDQSFKVSHSSDSGVVEFSIYDKDSNPTGEVIYKSGTDLKAAVENSSGGKVSYGDGAGEIKTTSNTITLDGVEFTLNGTGNSVISGTTDTTELVNKIKEFVEDYNSLMTSLTKYTTENKNRDYEPLTDDQKEELSEDEIKKWEEKVKQGQLKGDYDLTRILNSLKSCVEVTLGSSLSLEDIGIEQVDDYSSTKKNNLKIDENKLIEAIENNSEEIAKMFTDSETGIFSRMKSTLYDEFVSSTKSALIQKAGYEGTTYFTQNTLTKQINEYTSKISEMEKEMKSKEQSLYSKWANIETAMQKLNSQLSNLQSYFTSY